MTNIRQNLEGVEGFSTELSFLPTELDLVRNLIRTQWMQRIEESAPEHASYFKNLDMFHYHKQCHLLDHSKIWPKYKRILPSKCVASIRKTSLFTALEAEFGNFEISGEEGIEKEEIYWRLVRPNVTSDIGPMHADEWFWTLGHGVTPARHQRVKIWISIFSDIGKNGFKLVKGSHKKIWRYEGIFKDGLIKPSIKEDELSLGAEIFPSLPGQAIVFHDKLLHGGALGGENTRVSLEFTIFVRNEKYFV